MTSGNKPITHVQSLFLKHSGTGNILAQVPPNNTDVRDLYKCAELHSITGSVFFTCEALISAAEPQNWLGSAADDRATI